jgi:hypothetical protein
MVGVGVDDVVGVMVGVVVDDVVGVDGVVAGYVLPDELLLATIVGVGMIVGVGVDSNVAGYVLPDTLPCVAGESLPAALSFGKKRTVPAMRAKTSVTMTKLASTSPMYLPRTRVLLSKVDAAWWFWLAGKYDGSCFVECEKGDPAEREGGAVPVNPTLVPSGVTRDTGCGGRPDTGDS